MRSARDSGLGSVVIRGEITGDLGAVVATETPTN
jgi:hypothetical protein